MVFHLLLLCVELNRLDILGFWRFLVGFRASLDKIRGATHFCRLVRLADCKLRYRKENGHHQELHLVSGGHGRSVFSSM